MEYPPIKINPLDPNGISTSPSISEEELDHEITKNDLQRRYYEVYFTCFVGTYHTTKYNLLEGDFVIVQADRGHDVGVVSRLVEFEVSLVDEDHEIVSVVPKDEYPVRVMLQDKVIAQNQALEICRNKCVELLISTHIEVIATEFQFDRKKLTLYYKKHSDVSVCKLIRKLYNIFKMRIWMEPIDVELCNDSFSNITAKFLSLSQITIPPQEKTTEFSVSPQQQQQLSSSLSSSSQQSTSPTTVTTTTNTNTNVNSPTNINMNHINSTFSSISIPSSNTTSNVSTPGNTSPISAPFTPITPPTSHFTQKKNEIGTPVEKLKKSIIEPRRDMSTVENNMSFPNYVQLSQHQNVPTNIQHHQQQQQQIHQSQQSQSRQIYQGVPQSQSTFTLSNLTSINAGNNLSGHNNANNHNNNSSILMQQQQQHNYHHQQQQQQNQLAGTSAQYYRSAADQVQYSSRYNSKVIQERMAPRPVTQQQQQQIIRSSNYAQLQQQQRHTPIGQPSVNYNSKDPSYNNNGYYEGQYQYQQTNQNHNYHQQQTSTASYQDYDPHYRQQQSTSLTRQERVDRYVEMIDDRLFQGAYQKSNHNDGYYHNFNQNTNTNTNININKNSNHHNTNNNNNINQKFYHNYQPEQKYQEGNYRVANTPHQSAVHEDVGRYLTVDFLEDDIFTSTSIESSCDYYNFMPQSSSSIYYPTHG